MSYYQIIGGTRYDRSLLEAAAQFTTGRGESRISLEEIQALFRLANDGGRITAIEWRTLRYIAQRYPLTEPAQKWLGNQLIDNGLGLEQSIQRIIREAYGLPNLRWQITAEEVGRQQALSNKRTFESALRGALDAFLYSNQGQLSLAAVVARRDLAYQDSPAPVEILKSWLDQGTLFLAPTDAAARAALEFDLPDAADFNTFWVFGLHIPDMFPAQFVAFVLRDQAGQFSKGYFSRKMDLETLTARVVRQFAQFSHLEWQIDRAEVQRQLNARPGQNFGNALFYALHEGIFNGESSFSFRDFIQQEIWLDPERSVQSYQREYIETGTLRLLASPDDPAFGVPAQYWPGTDDVWVFGLEMPRKTHARFVVTVARDVEEIGFNDGFILETLPFEERARRVISEEFGAEGLQWVVHAEFPAESEYEAQRQQFGPEWRHFAGILRQALNTILHDYLHPQSVFNIVREVHRDEVNPLGFDTAAAYRDAIRHLILSYLKTGSIEFLPTELPDNNPVNGESVQANWLFFLRLPQLSDHGFFVVLPRWPEEGQLAYNYGAN
jgi:hypothetical protein